MRDDHIGGEPAESLNLRDLKAMSPKDLVDMAEDLEIENASTMRKGEMMFSILRERADEGWEISGEGVLEVLQDGFGFLRNPEANYLPGPDDIYVSPDMIRQHSLRTGDTVEGCSRPPTRRSATSPSPRSRSSISRTPEKARHKVSFDNLTPLYPDERLQLEIEDPTDQGPVRPDHRPGGAHREGPAVADRRAAPRPARRCSCRTSPSPSRPTTPNATSWSC